MKQRQLALTRQRNLVKNSVRTVQQNDLPLFAARLPHCGHVFSEADEHTSCADAASADVALATGGAGGPMTSSAESEVTDAAGNRPETASLSLSADSPSGPVFPAFPAHSAQDIGPLSPSLGAGWDSFVKDEEVPPEPARERAPQGRKFWRPWKSSKSRTVSISEAQVITVEPQSLFAAFAEESFESAGSLGRSSSSPSSDVKCFASSSSRAATPWQATLSSSSGRAPTPWQAAPPEEEDFDVTTTGVSEASQELANGGRIQLPIPLRRQSSEPQSPQLPIPLRRHCSEPCEIWIGASQPQPFPADAEGDVAPRSLKDSAPSKRGSRLRNKLWRKAKVSPEVEPLTVQVEPFIEGSDPSLQHRGRTIHRGGAIHRSEGTEVEPFAEASTDPIIATSFEDSLD